MLGSLTQVSPTTTTLHGSVPARAGAPFFTGAACFSKTGRERCNRYNCAFYENISGNWETKFPKKSSGVGAWKILDPGRRCGWRGGTYRKATKISRPTLLPDDVNDAGYSGSKSGNRPGSR
jgi:hypothetical protein